MLVEFGLYVMNSVE